MELVLAKQKELEQERNSLLVALTRIADELKDNIVGRESAERKAVEIERKYVKLLEQNDSNHLRTIEELTKRNSFLEQENSKLKEEIAELKIEIEHHKNQIFKLQTQVDQLLDDMEEMKREKTRKHQLFRAHDLLRLHNYYLLPVTWSSLTNELSNIRKSIPENLPDDQYDQEFNNRVQQLLESHKLQNFPLLALQQIANARTKEGHTSFSKAAEQYDFLKSITPDSFSELPEESRNALSHFVVNLQKVSLQRMN